MNMHRSFAAVVAALAFAPLAALGQGDDSAPPALVVQGQGSISRAPDTASISMTIETNDPSATQAQSQNNARYSAILAALGRVGVSESAVKTSGYDLRYVPPPEPTAEPAGGGPELRHTMPVARNPNPGERYGYIVTRTATVAGLDPSKVGPVIDACAAAGATGIDGVTFGLRNQNQARGQALAAAVADAASQAKALAAAAHVRLVRFQRIEAGQTYVPGPMPMARMATADVAPTQIPPSNVEVRASVTVTYAIAPI